MMRMKVKIRRSFQSEKLCESEIIETVKNVLDIKSEEM